MELSRKVGGPSGEPMAKKMMEFQESEKQRKRLEDQNLKLKLQIEDLKPKTDRAEIAAELLQSTLTKAKSDSSLSAFIVELQKIMDNLLVGTQSPKKVFKTVSKYVKGMC